MSCSFSAQKFQKYPVSRYFFTESICVVCFALKTCQNHTLRHSQFSNTELTAEISCWLLQHWNLLIILLLYSSAFMLTFHLCNVMLSYSMQKETRRAVDDELEPKRIRIKSAEWEQEDAELVNEEVLQLWFHHRVVRIVAYPTSHNLVWLFMENREKRILWF